MRVRRKNGSDFLNREETSLVLGDYVTETFGTKVYELKDGNFIHQDLCEIIEETHTSEAVPNQRCDISKFKNGFKYDAKKGKVVYNKISVKSKPGYKSSEHVNKVKGEING
jgi:hypothetical protein